MRRRKIFAAAFTALLCLAAGWACRTPSEEPPAPAPERVENPELGLAIADLPEIFRVTAMEADRMELELVEGEGHLEIVADEPESSINIVAAVNAHKEEILARPGGEYKGQKELVLEEFPGAAYYSRGRFEGEAGLVEETRMFMIHPWKDRQLEVIYTYPAGEDSSSRLQDELFLLVQELEGMPAPESETAEG